MFTVMLWDQNNTKIISRIDNVQGNETFLIQEDANRFPLLTDLADCAKDITMVKICPSCLRKCKKLGGGSKIKSIEYVTKIIELIVRAMLENKSILFTPFARPAY